MVLWPPSFRANLWPLWLESHFVSRWSTGLSVHGSEELPCALPAWPPIPRVGWSLLSAAAAEHLSQLFRREYGSARLCAQPCPAPAMFFTGCWALGSREDSAQGSFLGWAGPSQASVALLAFRGGGSGCSEQPWERVLPTFQQLLWRQPHI